MTALMLTCPVCAAAYPIEAGLNDLAARQALTAAMELWPAPLAPRLFAYLALFKPPKQHLRWTKLARLIEDLSALVKDPIVRRHHEGRPANLDAWGEGLAEVLRLAEAGSLTLPLAGHGLLCEIVHRQAGQRQQQAAAASRPLHPSHRPAAVEPQDRPAPATANPEAPPAPVAPETRPAAGPARPRAGGLAQIGEIAAALRGRRPLPTPDPSEN